MEATEQIIPHISVAKQDRILIWRNEVATASLDTDGSTTNDGASSRGGGASSSATSTTTSSSSSRSALVVARSRHLLSKLAHRLRPSSWRGPGHRPDGGDDDDAAVPRTAMYATLSPDYNPDGDDDDDDEDGLDDGETPARDAALRAKQQRLMRAARLLDKEPRV